MKENNNLQKRIRFWTEYWESKRRMDTKTECGGNLKSEWMKKTR